MRDGGFTNFMMVKSTAIVLSGALLAQLIGFVSIPILSRVFTPAEMGIFQIASAAMATTLPLSTLKYEFAILRVKANWQVAALLYTCIVMTVCMAVIVPSVGHLWRSLGGPLDNIWTSWMLFAMLTGGGIFQAVWQVAVRESRYTRMALAKPLQALVFNLFSIVGGFSSAAGAVILVLGDMLSRIASSAVALRKCDIWPERITSHLNIRRLRLLLWRHRKYPFFSVPSGIIGAFAASLPVFWLGAMYSDEVVGQFGMAWRTVFMPATMITLAISQVVNGRLSIIVRQNSMHVGSYIMKVAFTVTAYATLPILSLLIWGESALMLLLGPEWDMAGKMLNAMVPLLFSVVLGGPIGMTLVVIGRPDLQLYWDLSRLFLLVAVFSVCVSVSINPVFFVLGYSMAMLMASVCFLALSVWASHKSYAPAS
ncbi:lipopolysaccharide biosynthesis protein [Halomonas sp. LBP4]|uniref:lipopolysaccharide biosynthesis protein n=1 Tax=Halomonas sp. LBP4 TaxID=2044917 RepID=UPI000D7652F0|nr:oligosaccharide flippase family protein [Halomonas sp. LBP4]